MYMFSIVPAKLITPVELLTKTNPAGDDVNVPPAIPVMVGVGLVPDWQNVLEGYVNAAFCIGLIVIVEVAVTIGQPPEAAIVFVMVYVPAVLASKLTTPVAALILNPAVEVNVPAIPPPLNVGEGLLAF